MHYLLDWKVLWVCINLAAVKMALKPLKWPGKSLLPSGWSFFCTYPENVLHGHRWCRYLHNMFCAVREQSADHFLSIHLGQHLLNPSQFQLNWQKGEVTEINSKCCEGKILGQTGRTGGFVRILLGVWERQSDGGKCLQTLQLSTTCKVGGNQESLVLEQLFVFRFCFSVSFWKRWFLPGVRSWPLGNLDVIISSLPYCSLGALSVQHWGECKMGKHSTAQLQLNVAFSWSTGSCLQV